MLVNITLVAFLLLIVVLVILYRSKTTSSPTATSPSTTCDQTACNECRAKCKKPEYPRTDITGCQSYNNCLIKCGNSPTAICAFCDAPNLLTCFCGNSNDNMQCSEGNFYTNGDPGAPAPGLCMDNTNGLVCPPYPDIYKMTCQDSYGSSEYPGNCICIDTLNMVKYAGPILEAKPNMKMDCSFYGPTFLPVCGCINRDQLELSGPYSIKNNTDK